MKFNYATLTEARENGKLLFEANDPAADWDFDDMLLFKYKRGFMVFRDSGCSCPSPFEGADSFTGDYYSKTDLLKASKNWNDRTEKVMSEWIDENIN